MRSYVCGFVRVRAGVNECMHVCVRAGKERVRSGVKGVSVEGSGVVWINVEGVEWTGVEWSEGASECGVER